MRTSILIVTLLIAVFVFWCQLLLCVSVWNLAENVSEINHKIQITKAKEHKINAGKKRGKV